NLRADSKRGLRIRDRTADYATVRTQFCVPNELATRRVASGWSRHSPSTMSRYWYSPGASSSDVVHSPAAAGVRRTLSLAHWVKSPVTTTSFAPSARMRRETFFTAEAAGTAGTDFAR